MKRHRLGAWINRESYVDRKTGGRKTCATWTVRYKISKPGEPRRQKKVGGFNSYDDAAAWWFVQKQNPHRDVPLAEVVKPPRRPFPPTWRSGSFAAVALLPPGRYTDTKITSACTYDRNLVRCCYGNSLRTRLKPSKPICSSANERMA